MLKHKAMKRNLCNRSTERIRKLFTIWFMEFKTIDSQIIHEHNKATWQGTQETQQIWEQKDWERTETYFEERRANKATKPDKKFDFSDSFALSGIDVVVVIIILLSLDSVSDRDLEKQPII